MMKNIAIQDRIIQRKHIFSIHTYTHVNNLLVELIMLSVLHVIYSNFIFMYVVERLIEYPLYLYAFEANFNTNNITETWIINPKFENLSDLKHFW